MEMPQRSKELFLKATGDDQTIAVNDVTLTIGAATYGGSGADSMVFDIPFGVSFDNDGNKYTHLSTAEDWGDFYGMLHNLHQNYHLMV